MDAYMAELGNEAVTITAIVRYVSRSSSERKKLIGELERYFRSDTFRQSVQPPGDDTADFEERTRKLLQDLERSFERARGGYASNGYAMPYSSYPSERQPI